MLWEPQGEAAIRELLTAAKRQAQSRHEEEVSLALDYINGRQVDDVRSELQRRYPRTQAGSAGQEIAPFVVPIAERFVSEQANAYNHGVLRKVVLADGTSDETSKRLTDEYNRHLGECDFNSRMHLLDGYLCVLKRAGLWWQVKRGKLRPLVVTPDNIFPVADPNDITADASDPDDYLGWIIRLQRAAHADGALSEPHAFALSLPAQLVYYTTGDGDAYGVAGGTATYANPFSWQQLIDTPDMRGEVRDLPLQMFTMWSKNAAGTDVIEDADSDIVIANREINVALSMMLDTISHQGWAVPILKLLNPGAAPKSMAWGSRFPVPLQTGESMELVNASTPYQEIVGALSEVVKLLAISHRMSPSDFSTNGVSAESGFAKLVDSLPKIEARRERVARLKSQEEQTVWPRVASILRYLGRGDFGTVDLSKFKAQVEFDGLDFPETAQEQAAREEHDLKHNLTTRAKILAKRKCISLDEATAELEENLEANGVDVGILDGIQVSTLREVVTAAAAGEIPYESAVQIVQAGFRFDEATARAIVSNAGNGFTAAPEPAQQRPQAPDVRSRFGGRIGQTRRPL